MVLEEGEIDGVVCSVVLKWLEMPILSSPLMYLVLKWLEVSALSSLLGEVVFLLQLLACGVHHCLCWTLLSPGLGPKRSLV